jgi:hypothetical protein
MSKRGLALFMIPVITIIAIAYISYQDVRYKTGKLTIIQRYDFNSTSMDYELAHDGVAHAKFDGKDISIIMDSYGSGALESEEYSSYYQYLVKDENKMRRIFSPSGSLKKGDIIEIIYHGSMSE